MRNSGPTANTLAWIGIGAVGLLGLAGVVVWSQIPDVYAVNGLNRPIAVRVDGQELTVPPGQQRALEYVATGTEVAEYSLDGGAHWSSFEIDVSMGPDVVILNPAGAAYIFTQTVVYSVNSDLQSPDPVAHCGEQALRVERASHAFTAVPDEVEIRSSASTANRYHLDMLPSADCLQVLIDSERFELALPLAQLKMDPEVEATLIQLRTVQALSLEESAYQAWLEEIIAETGLLFFEEALQLERLNGPDAEALKERLKQEHLADPSNARAAYLYAQILPTEEALALLITAEQANPGHFYLIRDIAHRQELLGQFLLAAETIRRLYEFPEYGPKAHYWAAQNLARAGETEQAAQTLEEYAATDWDCAIALARLRGEVPKQVDRAWRQVGSDLWLRVYGGRIPHQGEDPDAQLSGLILNGSPEQVVSSRLLRNDALLPRLENAELMLLYIHARVAEDASLVKRVERQMAKRPYLVEAIDAPFEVPALHIDEATVAAACLGKLSLEAISGEALSEEERGDLRYNMIWFDPFGVYTEDAGWGQNAE